MRRLCAALLPLLLLTAQPVMCGEEAPTEIQEESGYSLPKLYLKMIITLGGVLGLAVASIWFLGRLNRGRLSVGNGSSVIKILDRRPLNQKTAIYVLDVLGRGVVIALSPTGVHPICEFPIGTSLEGLAAPQQSQSSSFSEIFRRVVTRKAKVET